MPTKRELKLIVFGAVFLLFIAGCAGGETTTGAPTTPFLGGAGGLEISFLEGNPPTEVTDDGTFPFQTIIILKNVGEQDVKKDEIKLSLIGFLPSQFGITDPTKLKDQTLLEDLSGRKRDADGNIIEPVEAFFTFPDKSDSTKNFNFNDKIAGNNIFVFRADACYKYQTRVKSDVCVLQNQIDVAADAICKPSEPKAVFSSGSPIKVTSFRQNVAGSNKLQLSFDVEHSGSGEVFNSVSIPIPTGVTTAISYLEVAITSTEGASKSVTDALPYVTGAKTALSPISGHQYQANINQAITKIEGAITDLDTSPMTDAAYAAANTKLREAKALLQNVGITGVSCPKDSASRRSNEDMVVIIVDTGLASGANNYKLSCVGGFTDVTGATAKQSGSVKLINGKRTITCTLDLPASRTDFIKPVDITVDFNYAQSADKEVLVKHILTNP